MSSLEKAQEAQKGMRSWGYLFVPLVLFCGLTAFAAEATAPPQIRDIAPPVEVFPYPAWMVVLAGIAAVILAGLLIWLVIRLTSRKTAPPPTAHAIALAALRRAREKLTTLDPYAFSILVSDILRDYLSAKFGLPATRQTSDEFLRALEGSSRFSADEKSLLTVFLEKCDLTKFARVEATRSDSEVLLDQAVQFVEKSALKQTPPAAVGSAA